MYSSPHKHIIFTRFGIGVQRASFHERRLAIMSASLVPCIAAQTNQNVHWLLVTDARAPEHVRAALSALSARIRNLHVRAVDPLVEYSLRGLSKKFVDEIVGSDEMIFLSRVDDDDAINRRFSEVMTTYFYERMNEGAALPIAASWTAGLEMYVGENKGRLARMPWLAPSIGIATRMDAFFNPMVTHWNVGPRAVANGGSAYEIDDQEPMWAWLKHKASDSSEFRRLRREIRDLPSSDGLPTSAFAFSSEALTAAYASTAADASRELETVDGARAAKTRLEAKDNLLRALRVIDGAIKNAEASGNAGAAAPLVATRSTIASLFYSI